MSGGGIWVIRRFSAPKVHLFRKAQWLEGSLVRMFIVVFTIFFFADFCEHVNYRKTVFLKINSRKQQYNMPKVKTKSRNHAIDQLAIFEIFFKLFLTASVV